jgi:hypothetical protein
MKKLTNRNLCMMDVCEFGKHTKSSYVSLRSRSSHAFDLVHSHVGLAKKTRSSWLARDRLAIGSLVSEPSR